MEDLYKICISTEAQSIKAYTPKHIPSRVVLKMDTSYILSSSLKPEDCGVDRKWWRFCVNHIYLPHLYLFTVNTVIIFQYNMTILLAWWCCSSSKTIYFLLVCLKTPASKFWVSAPEGHLMLKYLSVTLLCCEWWLNKYGGTYNTTYPVPYLAILSGYVWRCFFFKKKLPIISQLSKQIQSVTGQGFQNICNPDSCNNQWLHNI